MNILIYNWRDPHNPKSGGAEIVTLEHAKAWVKAGHCVTWFSVLFPHAKMTEKLEGITIVRKGSIYSMHIHAFFFYLISGKQFDIVIDEIHGIPFFTPFYVRKKKLAFIHEIAGEIWDAMYPFPINFIGKIVEKVMFLPYKHIPFLAVSESTKKELFHAGIHNVHVIVNGITPTHVTAEKEKLPTFIFVSRLVKMKGVESVIRAFSYIAQKDNKATLWIIGEGDKSYVAYLNQLVKDYNIANNISFLGRVSEKEKLRYMKKAHILLHASIKEGWGLVVVEAASQGTPAVVYNVGGLRDSVQHGKTGIVTIENTPEALAAETWKLYTDKQTYKEMQAACLQEIKEFTWEGATKKSLHLLANI